MRAKTDAPVMIGWERWGNLWNPPPPIYIYDS
jgi:hypothetical protein